MESLLQDVRYALRAGLRAPGFATAAVVALAIGIGANTAIFTLVDAVLIERLPFSDPSRLVAVWEENARAPGRPHTVGPANYLRWRERAGAFESMGGEAETRVNLTGGAPEELIAQDVTAGFFETLGVPALLGRTFTDAETSDPNSNVAVLGYDLWQRRFGGDPSIVGKAIQLNATAVTVVGVMPPGVRLFLKSGSLTGKPSDLWAPFAMTADMRIPRGRYLSVVARLKPGVSLREAQAQMAVVARGLAAEFPEFDTGWTVRLVPLRDEIAGQLKPALLVLAGAVAFVLLIACANVASLLLARGALREREIAIRSALGAGRGRLVRQLLTESLVLAAVGGGLGLLVAAWGLDLLVAISPVDVREIGPVHLDGTVLTFTVAVSLLTAVVAGFAPALEGARTDAQDALRGGGWQAGSGRRRRRMREVFVVSEIALALVLLVGAGLMLRSFASLRAVDPGFDSHGVLTVRVNLPDRKYGAARARPGRATRFFQDAVQRIAGLPGVQAAGAISFLPLAGLGAATDFRILGRPPAAPGQDLLADVRVCDDGYFQTMRVPLVRGRLFTDREMRERADVVIVNQTLARRYFAGQDPIGQRLMISMTDGAPTTIVGVVGDMHLADLTTAPRATTYWPHPQLAYNAMTLVVRTSGDPMAMAPSVVREIQSLDRDQPVSEVRTMDQWVARSLGQARFSSLMLEVFAAVALLLAALGIYSVVSYAVSQRTAEIGVRLALGAARRDILAMVVANGMKLATLGLGIGVLAALVLSRALESLLYRTAPADPATFTGVIALLGAVALLACYLPARRAARIAPVEALRYQ